jgi:hypothetical protein
MSVVQLDTSRNWRLDNWTLAPMGDCLSSPPSIGAAFVRNVKTATGHRWTPMAAVQSSVAVER